MVDARSQRALEKDVLRFAWRDSSPQMGYNWLWQSSINVCRPQIVETWQASIQLRKAIDDHWNLLKAEAEQAETKLVPPTEPLDEWKPWLDTIRSNVWRHVSIPVALTSGYKGVAHLCEAIAHSWSMEAPFSVSLDDHADTFRCHCGDFGNESGIHLFSLDSSVANLLFSRRQDDGQSSVQCSEQFLAQNADATAASSPDEIIAPGITPSPYTSSAEMGAAVLADSDVEH